MNYYGDRNLVSSFVVNTGISNCPLKCISLDQIGKFNCSASARKGTSDLCDNNFCAFVLRDVLTSLSSIISDSNAVSNKKSDLDMFDLEQINSEYFFNSLMSSLGANSLILYFSNNSLVKDFALNREKTILVSITSSIDSPYLCFEMSSLNFLPSLMQSLSVNLEFSKSFSNFLSINSLLTFSDKNSLISSDQLISGSCSILCFNGSDIDTVIFFILLSPQYLLNTQDTQVYKGFDMDMGKIFQMYQKPYDLILHRLEILFLEYGKDMSRIWEGYVSNMGRKYHADGKKISRRREENITQMGTNLYNDSGKDIDEFAGVGNAEFEGYAGASLKLHFFYVTQMGMGTINKPTINKPSRNYLNVQKPVEL